MFHVNVNLFSTWLYLNRGWATTYLEWKSEDVLIVINLEITRDQIEQTRSS